MKRELSRKKRGTALLKSNIKPILATRLAKSCSRRNKLAKLRRYASRVDFGSTKFEPSIFLQR